MLIIVVTVKSHIGPIFSELKHKHNNNYLYIFFHSHISSYNCMYVCPF